MTFSSDDTTSLGETTFFSALVVSLRERRQECKRNFFTYLAPPAPRKLQPPMAFAKGDVEIGNSREGDDRMARRMRHPPTTAHKRRIFHKAEGARVP